MANELYFDNQYSFDQYFVYIDRNPEKQNIMVGFYTAETSSVEIIGWDKVSTGNPNRPGYFITPLGVFRNYPKGDTF